MGKPSKEDVLHARETLRKFLPPADKTRHEKPGKFGTQQYTEYHSPKTVVYQIVRSVSRSGMSRTISTYAVSEGQLVCLDWAIGTLLGGLKREGVRIGGCGMDMGFAMLDHAVHAAYSELEYKERPSANDYDLRWL